MYRAWKGRRQNLRPIKIDSTSGLLTRAMYDVKPHTYGTYRDLLEVLGVSKGALTTINHSEFASLLDRDFDGKGIRGLLQDHGIEIGATVVERTGLIALAGALKEIDQGRVRKGERVLWCLTSGVNHADAAAKPEYKISSLRSMIGRYGRRLSLTEQYG